MSDKAVSKLNELDTLIRQTAKGGMEEGTLVRIEFVWGFELFNTRPHHNYETWSGGYRVEGRGQTARSEDLDDALKAWAAKVEESDADKDSRSLLVGRSAMGVLP